MSSQCNECVVNPVCTQTVDLDFLQKYVELIGHRDPNIGNDFDGTGLTYYSGDGGTWIEGTTTWELYRYLNELHGI